MQWQCITDDKGTVASYNKYVNDQIEAFHLSEKNVGAELILGKINNNNYKIIYEGM